MKQEGAEKGLISLSTEHLQWGTNERSKKRRVDEQAYELNKTETILSRQITTFIGDVYC